MEKLEGEEVGGYLLRPRNQQQNAHINRLSPCRTAPFSETPPKSPLSEPKVRGLQLRTLDLSPVHILDENLSPNPKLMESPSKRGGSAKQSPMSKGGTRKSPSPWRDTAKDRDSKDRVRELEQKLAEVEAQRAKEQQELQNMMQRRDAEISEAAESQIKDELALQEALDLVADLQAKLDDANIKVRNSAF